MEKKMYSVKCACGEKNKNFKFVKPDFFIEECCIAKGYDHNGVKASDKVTKTLTELSKMTKPALQNLAEKWGVKENKTRKELKSILWDLFSRKS